MKARGDGATIYVVDDDEAVRDALAMVLRSAGYAVETFESAAAFLALRGDRRAGCLVLDVRMPGMSGLELQDRLTMEGSRLPIVFLTGHGDVPMAVRALKRGAFDFIQKPVDDRQLLGAVGFAIGQDTRPAPDAELNRSLPATVASLSRREREVLDLILAGRQTRAIADELFISIKTVEFHRGRIHDKLGVSSLAELFSVCFGRHYTSPRQQ